jgi:hypothetical protein
MTFHKTVSAILWQLMDMVHGQTSGGSTPTPDVPLASLIPLVTMEENMHKLYGARAVTDGVELCS